MKINEKNLCTFAVTPPVDLDGFLNKRGEVNKSWQKRWFVLKGNLLFYFEKRGDKEPLGVIILEGCTIELAEDGEPYCFKIIFHGEKDRSYLLASETQEIMEKWMKALTCAGYEYMKLMVSELQRQLEELEDSHKVEKGNGRSGCNNAEGSSIKEEPKAPPRRHNPFNRPAPPIPTGAVAGAGTPTKTNSNGTTTTNGVQVEVRQKEFATQRKESMILLGDHDAAASSSSAGAIIKDAQSGSEGNVIKDDSEDRFSFGTLHAALGQSFVQDRIKRRQEEASLQKSDDEVVTELKQGQEKCDEMKRVSDEEEDKEKEAETTTGQSV